MKRRDFLRNSLIVGGAAMVSSFPLSALSKPKKLKKLTILHTNDVHSRLEAFPMNDPKFAGQGGIQWRMDLLNKIRKEEDNILLIDSGDMFQGTPYFNVYLGKPEIEAMNLLGYEAGTIGNHDFDAGMEVLAERISEAKFPIINCNYDFSNTPLKNLTIPYKVLDKQGIKVGITGIGIDPTGLIPERWCKGVEYLDPIENAEKIAKFLKEEMHCDIVICISHLGVEYKGTKPSDVMLAKSTKYIDFIFGGHTHTFLYEPIKVTNSANKLTLIMQSGWAGLCLGRLDVSYSENRKNRLEKHTLLG